MNPGATTHELSPLDHLWAVWLQPPGYRNPAIAANGGWGALAPVSLGG